MKKSKPITECANIFLGWFRDRAGPCLMANPTDYRISKILREHFGEKLEKLDTAEKDLKRVTREAERLSRYAANLRETIERMRLRKTLTIREVANLLQVDPQTIRKMIRRGQLKAQRIGRDWRVSRKSYEEFLEGRAL